MADSNVALREGFEDVFVIEGMHLGDTSAEDFERDFGGVLGARVQFLETVETLPDRDASGALAPDTGGRADTLLAIHEADLTPEVEATRRQFRIRRLEDVLSLRNHPHGRIHPERLLDYLPPLVRDLVRDGA